MKSLFIDTSNSDVSIAIIEDGKILAKITKNIPNEHSVFVVPYIKEVFDYANLTFNEIDKLMICTGPGSFTGIRIGLTVGKIYGYLQNIEIIPMSSLKMLSFSGIDNIRMVLLDARNNNYYVGVYDNFGNDIIKEHFASFLEVLDIINKYKDIELLSNHDFMIADYVVKGVSLDIEKIVNYYQKEISYNAHAVMSNYLKLPQAVEEYHD